MPTCVHINLDAGNEAHALNYHKKKKTCHLRSESLIQQLQSH